MDLIERAKEAMRLAWNRRAIRLKGVERQRREMAQQLQDAKHRTDSLVLLVRGMRRKEDWGNG